MSEPRHVSLVQAPPARPHPYNVVLLWIQQEHPELAKHFDLTLLPADPLPNHRLATFWLQDPTEFISLPLYHQALAFEQACDENEIPIINRPSKQFTIGKREAERRLSEIGIRTPRIDCFHFDDPPGHFPYLLREDISHAGEFFLINSQDDLALVRRELFFRPVAAEFLEVCSDDGLYRKYRAVVIGDRVISHHLQISEVWLTRGNARLNNLQTREEEIEYVSQPDRFADQLRQICKALELEFLGIDYAIAPNGEFIFWEANLFPHLHFSTASLTYRNFAMHRTMAAMIRTYLELAGIEPTKKLIRQASYDD